ncbi:MAG: hypothetical protein ACTHKG_10140 [Nocardioides sp.]
MSSSNPSGGTTGEPTGGRDAGDWYEIRVEGRLDNRWAAWFDGLDLSRADDGTTALRGPVTDQAALHGLLHKLRDLGVTLLSVTRTDPGADT